MTVKGYYISSEYFAENSNFTKMLDVGNVEKQSRRSYICVKVSLDNNDYYIPLRNSLGNDVRAFGRIGHKIPSQSRPNAGLDYRYALIINDSRYVSLPKNLAIPKSQRNVLSSDYDKIVSEFSVYVNGFKKALAKNRIEREPLYRESSLINFVELLKLGMK